MADPDPAEIETRARSRVLSDHRSVVTAIRAAAADVAGDWPGRTTRSRSEAVDSLSTALAERDVLPAVPTVLEDVGRHAGLRPTAKPVAAPPYVVVTGAGVVMRLPTPERRLVITVRTFRVRGQPPRYRFVESSPAETLQVELRSTP